MDAIKNPFSPGAGSPPPELVGREGVLEQARILSSTYAKESLIPKMKATDAEIDAEVTNACRCSTYHRIRKAIHLAASRMSAGGRG